MIDNASSDGSVCSMVRRAIGYYSTVKWKNVGFPAGRSQGIKLAQKDGDIFLLNNDADLPLNAFDCGWDFMKAILWALQVRYQTMCLIFKKCSGIVGRKTNF